MPSDPKYVVVTRTVSTGDARLGRFARPVTVRVMAVGTSEWHAVRGLAPGLVYKSNPVDTRYTGPRSRYTAEMSNAKKMCDELNAKASS